ncbi:hypothetical protein J6590_083885 [Homalodisca vitripennis]|nr:hypothetical protein J6590_083885 [Homalodisca vitripennis]
MLSNLDTYKARYGFQATDAYPKSGRRSAINQAEGSTSPPTDFINVVLRRKRRVQIDSEIPNYLTPV